MNDLIWDILYRAEFGAWWPQSFWAAAYKWFSARHGFIFNPLAAGKRIDELFAETVELSVRVRQLEALLLEQALSYKQDYPATGIFSPPSASRRTAKEE